MVSACFLINRALWQGGPPFDESLGFNLEDHDFAVGARLAGHSLWVQPAATVRHGWGTAGLSYRPGRKPPEARVFYLTRNRWIIVLRCFAGRTLLVLAPALLLFEAMQLVWLVSEGRGAVWGRALRSLVGRRRELRAERRRAANDGAGPHRELRRGLDAGAPRDEPDDRAERGLREDLVERCGAAGDLRR
jgi:GT2 family glycosyltransferase